MIKKILKWFGIVVGIIIVLIIVAGVVLMLIIDEKMIASQMENFLNRHVTIQRISIGVFAVASGIEVRDVRISNYKTKKELTLLKDKPVTEKDLFVGLKAFNFKIKIIKLFSGQVVLDELVLYEPVINVVKNKNGAYNFDDLIKPGAAEKKEEKKETPKTGPSKPFTADDLPIEISVGKIGLEKGRMKYVDESLGQTFQVYNLTTLIHSIKIDPKDLMKKDSVGLAVEMGVKTIGELKTGSVKSFDIGFDIKGTAIPFDKKTRIANPEIDLKMGLPYGSLTGLQIFEKLKEVEQLAKYTGKLEFLKKEIKWKNAYVNVWYKNNLVKLKEGKIPTDDYELTYAGQTNLSTKAVDMDMDMLLADKHEKPIRSGIEKNVKKAIPAKAAKYVKSEKVTDIAMKSLMNKDGKIQLTFKVTGKLNDPKTKLVSPKLSSISDVIKDSSADIKDAVKEQAKEKVKEEVKEAKEEAKEKIEKKTDKAKDKAKDKLKKKFKF
ncbi:MAG: AsmA family protein [Spirochaetes bacterium]|nr:AsmA family protein [Spirochaetota bacterium]